MKRFALLFLVLMLGCKSAQVSSDKLPVIYMKKTACMGTCPDYDISIFADGRVELNARQFMELEGSFESQLSESDLNELLKAFNDSEFSSFEKSYTSYKSDLPTTTLTFRQNGNEMTVVDYDGAPESLKELERRVHQLVDDLEWNEVQ